MFAGRELTMVILLSKIRYWIWVSKIFDVQKQFVKLYLIVLYFMNNCFYQNFFDVNRIWSQLLYNKNIHLTWFYFQTWQIFWLECFVSLLYFLITTLDSSPLFVTFLLPTLAIPTFSQKNLFTQGKQRLQKFVVAMLWSVPANYVYTMKHKHHVAHKKSMKNFKDKLIY